MNVATVNRTVRRTGRAPSAKYTAATISDGFSESGSAIAMTASASAGIIRVRFGRAQTRRIIRIR